MQYKDEFDDPDFPRGFRRTINAIVAGLSRRDKLPRRHPVRAGAIVIGLTLFLFGVLWYSYPRESEKRDIMALPVIYADARPFKVIPQESGGMDIPHRDSTVFETLHAGQSENNRSVENLLDHHEEPVARDQIFAGLKTELKVEGRDVLKAPETVDDVDADTASMDTPDITEIVSITATPVPQEKPDNTSASMMSQAEPAAGVEVFKTDKTNRYFIQLASLKSQDDAKKSWLDLQKKTADLKILDYRVKMADLGARGIYYRLQAGPLSESRAREICASIQAQRPGGCLVVKD